ncbi:MAG: DUF2834 domain-containing protein [Pseudomonadota bacterium]
MTPIKWFCLILLVPFTALTVYAVQQVGYVGVVAYQGGSPAGWQVFTDLVIALLLVMVWMFVDARRNGRNVWPFVLATLCLGSFGPLLYLLLAPSTGPVQAGEPAQS